MKSKARLGKDKISTAVQAYIDAYDRRPGDRQARDVFLSLPRKIQVILTRHVPVEDLFDIHTAVIQQRQGLVTVH
jgi:hypothetical protein